MQRISLPLRILSTFLLCLTLAATCAFTPDTGAPKHHDQATAITVPSPAYTPTRTALPFLPTPGATRAPEAAATHASIIAVTTSPARSRPVVHRTVRRAPAHTSRAYTRKPISTPSTGSPRAYARSVLSAGQYSCLSSVVERESGWNVYATNPSSGAYGLGQALPGSKMASYGSDWRTNGVTQIRWVIHYMNSRYGSPCDAWSFWQRAHWY